MKDYQYDTVTLKMYAVENSKYSLKLNHQGTTRNTVNDVDGAFQGKTVEIDGSNYDPNLETTVTKYKAQAYTDTNKRNAVRTYGLVGSTNQLEVSEEPGVWISEAAQKSIDEITQTIEQEIHLSPEINFENYPVPQDYLREIKEDLITKIEKNQTRYANKDQYLKGAKYKSAAAKTISIAREWYIDEIIYQIDTKYSQAAHEIEEKLNQTMGAKNASDTENAARNAAQILKNKLYLPLGITMQAYHADEKGNKYPEENIKSWRENTTLTIDQEPNYLDPDQPYGAKKVYTLKIRNTNLFNLNGVNILPTLDPWITTINAWTINVEGEYVEFKIYDIDNEVHPDPIFGHQAQVYVREDEKIPDPVNDNNFIGSNTRIKFSFNTGTFIAVPAENDYGIVKAWFNGKPATVEGISLKIQEPAEIKVEITAKTEIDFIFIRLDEPGFTRAFEVIEGPSKIGERINYEKVEKNWSKNFTWKVRPNGAWVDGNAPINILVQFKKAYGYTSGYNSKDAYFSVANPYILNERFAGAPSEPAPSVPPVPSTPPMKTTPGFGLLLAFCALAGAGLLARRR